MIKRFLYIFFSTVLLVFLIFYFFKLSIVTNNYSTEKMKNIQSAKCLIPDKNFIRIYFDFTYEKIRPISNYLICGFDYYNTDKNYVYKETDFPRNMPLSITTIPYTLDERIKWVGASKHSIIVTKRFEYKGELGVVGKYCWSECSNNLLYSYNGNVIEIESFNPLFNNPDKLIDILKDVINNNR